MMKTKILGLIRHLLTFGGGFLVGKELIDGETMNQAVAALMTIIGAAWSIADKNSK